MYLSSHVELTRGCDTGAPEAGCDTGAPEAGRGGGETGGGTPPGEVTHLAGSVSDIGYKAGGFGPQVPLGKLEPRRPSKSRRPAAITAKIIIGWPQCHTRV